MSEQKLHTTSIITQHKGGTSGDPTQIFVRSVDGRTLTLDVDLSDTVDTVKRQLESRAGVPVQMQRLVHAGRDLRDEPTLLDCGIERQSTLHLVPRLRGGAFFHGGILYPPISSGRSWDVGCVECGTTAGSGNYRGSFEGFKRNFETKLGWIGVEQRQFVGFGYMRGARCSCSGVCGRCVGKLQRRRAAEEAERQRRARTEAERQQRARDETERQRRDAEQRRRAAEHQRRVAKEEEARRAAEAYAKEETKDPDETIFTWEDDAASVLPHAGPPYTAASIRKAWIKKSVFWHPDKWTASIKAWVDKRKAFSIWKSATTGKSFLAQLLEDQQKILTAAKEKLDAEHVP